MKKTIFSMLMFVVATVVAIAAKQPYFIGTCDKDALEYKLGEKMKFSINLVDEDGNIIEGKKLNWMRRGDDGKTFSGSAVSAKEPLVIETSIDCPGFVRVTVTPVDDEGKRIKDFDIYDGGACADFKNIKQVTPEPADFDAFWAKQLAALNKISMEVDRKEIKGKEGFKTYELTIACVGKPAKAYLTIPTGTLEKSLPINMIVHGYGVSRINPHYNSKAICLSVARHSYKLGQSDEYYKEQKVILQGFGLKKEVNINPENNYFKFMILRDIRALEYVKTLPEWNKKDIIVSGGSMGGFQSIFVAYLDKDVTLCRPNVPWMCNLNCVGEGKQKALFAPQYIPEVLYFDSTNAAKRVKCPMVITAQLGDYVCPPAGIVILYNNTRKASLEFAQNGTHGYRTPWKKNPVYKVSK